MEINPALTIKYYLQVNISSMPSESLRIDDQPGTQPGHRILRLDGALVMTTMFEFQATVRADNSRALIIDLANVPYVDSTGIGALVGAYVTRQHGGRSLALVAVSEQFFRSFDSVSAAEEAYLA
jgi:anti-anti-sigma factor